MDIHHLYCRPRGPGENLLAEEGCACCWPPVRKPAALAQRWLLVALTRDLLCPGVRQMVVLTMGQMLKPEKAVKSPMATDPGVTGKDGSSPSEGFTSMLNDYKGIQKATNNSLTNGYFMDGGGLIAGYNG